MRRQVGKFLAIVQLETSSRFYFRNFTILQKQQKRRHSKRQSMEFYKYVAKLCSQNFKNEAEFWQKIKSSQPQHKIFWFLLQKEWIKHDDHHRKYHNLRWLNTEVGKALLEAQSATTATSAIAEVALRFNFLFWIIAEVALRTRVFKIWCALIALRFQNFFRLIAQFYTLNLILFHFDRNIANVGLF